MTSIICLSHQVDSSLFWTCWNFLEINGEWLAPQIYGRLYCINTMLFKFNLIFFFYNFINQGNPQSMKVYNILS